MAHFCATATGPPGRLAWGIIPPPLTVLLPTLRLPLAEADARLAEITSSFSGTFTPYLLPVRLAHQIRTFRIGLRLGVVGVGTAFFFVGWIVPLAALVQWIPRSVKSLKALSNSEPCRPRRRSSCQAGRPAPLRSAGRPAWRRNRQCTNIET